MNLLQLQTILLLYSLIPLSLTLDKLFSYGEWVEVDASSKKIRDFNENPIFMKTCAKWVSLLPAATLLVFISMAGRSPQRHLGIRQHSGDQGIT